MAVAIHDDLGEVLDVLVVILGLGAESDDLLAQRRDVLLESLNRRPKSSMNWVTRKCDPGHRGASSFPPRSVRKILNRERMSRCAFVHVLDTFLDAITGVDDITGSDLRDGDHGFGTGSFASSTE